MSSTASTPFPGSLLPATGTPGTGTGAPNETRVPLTGEHPVARVDLMPPEIHERRRFA